MNQQSFKCLNLVWLCIVMIIGANKRIKSLNKDNKSISNKMQIKVVENAYADETFESVSKSLNIFK